MSRALPVAIAAAALVVFVVFSTGNILTNSLTTDEGVHLAAGWSYHVTGDYRLNAEHPPLLKKLATLPMLSMDIWPRDMKEAGEGQGAFAEVRKRWDESLYNVPSQWWLAHELLFGRRDSAAGTPTTIAVPRSVFLNDAETIIRRGRFVMLLFGVALGIAIFLWSRELWGLWGAAISTLLYAFDPNFIAHSGLVTTDVGTAFFMFVAIWFFWRACERLTIGNAAVFSIAFALAQTSKYSAVLLVPMILVIAVHRFVRKRTPVRNVAILIAAAIVVTIGTLWAVYGFRYAASPGEERPLRKTIEEWYATAALVPRYPDGPPDEVVRSMRGFTRVGLAGRAVLYAKQLHIVPESYLWGFAVVRRSSFVRDAFLRGEFRSTGFRSYFLWTFLYKTTVPALIAIAVALWTARRTKQSALPFLLWPVVIYLAVSIPSAMNIGHRHLFPIYPFLYVLCGSLALTWKKRRGAALAILAAALVIASLVVIAPRPASMWGRHLSYMNELSGGPWNGHEKLLDSNIDWGQDLGRLAAWLRAHDVREPINLVYNSSSDPSYYGIAYRNLVFGSSFVPELPISEARPGIFAITVSRLQGIGIVPEERQTYKRFLADHGAVEVGRAGYSMVIYRIK